MQTREMGFKNEGRRVLCWILSSILRDHPVHLYLPCPHWPYINGDFLFIGIVGEMRCCGKDCIIAGAAHLMVKEIVYAGQYTPVPLSVAFGISSILLFIIIYYVRPSYEA